MRTSSLLLSSLLALSAAACLPGAKTLEVGEDTAAGAGGDATGGSADGGSGSTDGGGTDGGSGSTDGGSGSTDGGSGSTDGGGTDGGGTDGGGTDGGSGGTDGGSGGTDGGGTEPEVSVVRFIAMGDGGEGNDTQYAVSDAVEAICAAKTDSDGPGCDFALYLGDNFYDEGVSSVTDEQFQSKFEQPYANLDFPFMVVLGNHDYGGCIFGSCGAGYEFEKADYYVDYTASSDKWTLPSEYYTFVEDNVQFFGLDTNAIMWDPWLGTAGEQPSWLADELAASTAEWKIAFGHHPYISNGEHGNAGAYEGLDWLDWLGILADVPLGTAVEEVMSDTLCGQADLYICGHDHNRQWLEPTCGTEFIVMGTASKTTDLPGRGNPTFFEDDSEAGFIWIEIRGSELTGEIYNVRGELDFSQTIDK